MAPDFRQYWSSSDESGTVGKLRSSAFERHRSHRCTTNIGEDMKAFFSIDIVIRSQKVAFGFFGKPSIDVWGNNNLYTESPSWSYFRRNGKIQFLFCFSCCCISYFLLIFVLLFTLWFIHTLYCSAISCSRIHTYLLFPRRDDDGRVYLLISFLGQG